MTCTIIIHQPQAIPDRLTLTSDQLRVGDSPDAHLWVASNTQFTLWLDDQSAPLLDASQSVNVNGQATRRQRLNTGDRIRFGDNELRFDGRDNSGQLLFYWRTGSPAPARPTPATPNPVWGRLLLLAMTATLLFLPWSLVQFGEPDQQAFSPEQGKRAPSPAHPLEHWLASGPLHPAHSNTQCGDCHLAPGEPVDNSSCFACHDMQRHFSREKTGVHPQCIACHLEHNEPSNLIEADNRLCLQCHNNLALVEQVLTPGTKHALTPFEHFEGAHPAFRNAQPNQLNFNHQQHLAADLKPDQQALNCRDCHQWRDGNPQPVRFADSCSQCHSTEDARDQLVWPHGNLTGLLVFAEQQGFNPSRALAVANSDTCRVCHQATLPDANLETLTNTTPWQYPVAGLNARFSHKRHEGRLACHDCHAAGQSTESRDSLLPGKESCTGCHNQTATEPLPNCLTCHQFHHVVWPALDAP